MPDGDVESELDEHDRRIGENSMKSSKALVRINELEAENKQLRERIERLEAIVESNPDDVEYERLTKRRKVHRVRAKLVEIAENTNGKASMFYDDVMNEFGGRPSPGHAYDLMEAAAERDGFKIDEGSDGKKRVTVKTDAVNDIADFHGVNKAVSEEAI